LLGRHAALREYRPDRLLAGTPPIRRILFGPGGSLRSEGLMFRGRRSDRGTIIRDDDGARSARADVDS